MPAGPPLVLIEPTLCSERPARPENRITLISSSTMHCTNNVLPLADQAMPWHQRPIESSAVLVSWVPVRDQICNRPLPLKNGEFAGLLEPFITVTATNLPSGESLMPAGVWPTV